MLPFIVSVAKPPISRLLFPIYRFTAGFSITDVVAIVPLVDSVVVVEDWSTNIVISLGSKLASPIKMFAALYATTMWCQEPSFIFTPDSCLQTLFPSASTTTNLIPAVASARYQLYSVPVLESSPYLYISGIEIPDKAVDVLTHNDIENGWFGLNP